MWKVRRMRADGCGLQMSLQPCAVHHTRKRKSCPRKCSKWPQARPPVPIDMVEIKMVAALVGVFLPTIRILQPSRLCPTFDCEATKHRMTTIFPAHNVHEGFFENCVFKFVRGAWGSLLSSATIHGPLPCREIGASI